MVCTLVNDYKVAGSVHIYIYIYIYIYMYIYIYYIYSLVAEVTTQTQS
jgi:hypothetical protein